MDVVISYDTTGSMRSCIYETKRKIAEVVTKLFHEYDDLRIGIIAHGDYCDTDTYITRQFQLSNKRDDIVDFVNTTGFTSGGDSDECYELVLHTARSFDWRDGEKVFILVGDADPHDVGYRYHMHVNELDWRIEARLLAEQGVKIYSVKCLNNNRSNWWNEVARIGNGYALNLHQFSDILRLFSAVVYKSVSHERVEQYRNELQTEGALNRNLASIIDNLLGKETVYVEPEKDKWVYSSHLYGKVLDGLREVDPTRFQVLHVDHNQDIQSFVDTSGAIFSPGKGFYELTKTEEVQERKEVILQDKITGDMFSGKTAREMVGLPYGIRGKLKPIRDFKYHVFVQSTSYNRKLMAGTRFLYDRT